MTEPLEISDEIELHAVLKGHTSAVTSIDFNPNDFQFATASEDRHIIIWNNWRKSINSNQFSGHSGAVNCLEYSKCGTLIASGSKDQYIRLWEPSLCGGCKAFKAHTASVNTISFSPDGMKLLSGSNDKSLKLWDVNTQKFISSYLGNNNWVHSVKFSSLGDVVSSCSDDKTIRFWDIRSGELIQIIHNLEIPNVIAMHANNKNIAAAMNNGTIKIFDFRQKKLIQLYSSLHNNVTCLDWHPSDKYLLSGGLDGNLQIIDIIEGRPLHTLCYMNSVSTCKFNYDGNFIGAAGSDKEIVIWKLNRFS